MFSLHRVTEGQSTVGDHTGISLHKRDRGFTLIEVLVAVVVMAIGLLGVASLQIGSVKRAQDAYARSQAAFLAYSIADAMRVNLPSARAGLYDLSAADPSPMIAVTCIGEGATCSPAELATFDVAQWRTAIAAQLVDGNSGVVSVYDAARDVSQVTVRILWRSISENDAASELTVAFEI